MTRSAPSDRRWRKCPSSNCGPNLSTPAD